MKKLIFIIIIVKFYYKGIYFFSFFQLFMQLYILNFLFRLNWHSILMKLLLLQLNLFLCPDNAENFSCIITKFWKLFWNNCWWIGLSLIWKCSVHYKIDKLTFGKLSLWILLKWVIVITKLIWSWGQTRECTIFIILALVILIILNFQ